MKKLIYIFLILLGFTSCMKEDKGTMEPEATDKVDIVFGVNLPEPLINTKVMADKPQVQNLKVAVFGGSGYLKEYVEATPVDLATTNETRYNYKVSLSLTDSHIKVHFIANGPATLPFKYEDEVMSLLMTEGNQDAYWQRIELPNGITAQKDEDGAYIKGADNKYIVTNESKAYFQNIPLIRNFAKIQVTADDPSTSNFALESYALVNVPNSGSVAAYNRTTSSFIMDYHTKTFAQIKAQYPGNLPATATINKTIPAASAFSANPVYMYERPIPTSDATFLLVYGTYTPTNKKCYYRIELQDADGYYAIYRNFLYTVNIKGILREGADNPTDAANSSGSGDISTDQKAENLTDVSDGIARIFVQYTDTTVVGNAVTVTLKYMFLPDATKTTTANGAVSGGVGVDIAKHEVGSTGAVIDGEITRGSSDEDGWRTLSFTTTNAGEVTKTESIKITGHYMNGSVASKLFRIVNFHLMSLQPLDVICNPHDLLKGKGEKVDVLIKIPKDLPRSLFPLQLKIESDENSITPDNDNLPVTPGKSIKDGTTASYQFIKTVEYDDYLALQEASSDEWVTITTHFKTTKESSDCNVYVANKYFITDHDNFMTYTMHSFKNLNFDNNSQMSPEMPVVFSFETESDIPSKITIKLNGLKPATGSPLIPVTGVANTYEYNTIGSNLISLNLLTSTDEGVYGAEISASHYYTASIGNLSYDNPRFTSTAAAGRNKPINFAFGYVNDIIEPVTFTLSNLKPQPSDTRFEEVGDGVWTFTPNNSEVDQSITFLTESWDNVSLSMSGTSYNSSSANSNAAATMNIEANSIVFDSDDYNRYLASTPMRMYDTRTYTEFNTNNNRRNNSSFTITRADLNDNYTVYFRLSYYNLYSGAISVYDLDEATTSSRYTVNMNNTSAPSL